ncbi:HNH endonuclease signature motif containing protein [Demequina sp. NBRC 110054]|uniref:HNH endonuclease signature motif containing protein n=1 Tax=Demequina sp. NBRC 110054 TaxID=1570343 RepID=UPI0009FE399D|nr:HNH endonuclease signature motif containing protein [Demequina sp. NBRC 110054]
MAIGTAEVERVSAQVHALAQHDCVGLPENELLDLTVAIARLERLVGALGSRVAGEIMRLSDPDQPGGGFAREQGFGNAGGLLSKVRGGSFRSAQNSMAAGEAFAESEEDGEPEDEGAGVTPGDSGPTGGSGSPEPDGAPDPEPEPEPKPKPKRHKYPYVAAAQLDGSLSTDAAGIIVRGLNSLTGKVDGVALRRLEERLVARAAGKSSHEVAKMVSRAVARADQAAHEEREKKNHGERYLWWKQESDGMTVIHGRLDAATAAPIIAVLEQMTTRDVRNQARPGEAAVGGVEGASGATGEGAGSASAGSAGARAASAQVDPRSKGQMRADALFALARHALGCAHTATSGVRTTMVIRMNLEDLRSGVGLGSIDGVDQPVSITQLRRLAGDAGVIPEVLGRDGAVLNLGRQQRLFSRSQRVALAERDGGCARCHAPIEHCEAHHIDWWEHGGRTDLSNGVMLCTRCHHDTHTQGWGIEVRGSRVYFVPPASQDPIRTPVLGGVAALELDAAAAA